MRDLVFSLVLAWTHGWISRWVAGDLRRYWGSLWRHCNDASFKLFCLILRVLDLVYEALWCICTLYHFSKRTGTGSWKHYNDAIMSAMTSQITSVSIVYSTVCSGIDQIKHQSSVPLAFVRGIHRWPVNSPHKGPVTRKVFPFDGVTMKWIPWLLMAWRRKELEHPHPWYCHGNQSSFTTKRVNPLRPRHSEDIFKSICLKEDFWIWNRISFKCIS